jgi:hypothetical protein
MEGLDDDKDIDDALLILWNSSRQVLANYLELLRVRHLNYSWSCLYTIFMAEMANVYCVGCFAQRKTRGVAAFVPSYWDAISDARDCSNLLTAFCERWNDARPSCDIFNRLSMTALKGLAAVNFSQSNDDLITTREGLDVDQTSFQAPLETTTTKDRLACAAASSNHANRATESLEFTTTSADNNQRPLSSLNDLDPIVDFQQVFQEMQSSMHRSDFTETNEVLRGCSQDWF